MDLKAKGFQLPESVQFDSESLTDTYGRLSAEAFGRGFGTTVGNALRRVLLSSIEGAAVTSVRIPGVLHEFSTMPGVKEDVVDIILNIKQLRFRVHSDEPQTVTISKNKAGAVIGKDVETGAQVELLNPEQHIATIEKNVDFKAEMTVQKGMGYVTAEQNQDEDKPIDAIAVDSIYTPIKKVNFWVEGARVGRSTDFDKLIMDIWTDGSISPQDALSQAAEILQGHLAIFSGDAESLLEESAPESAPERIESDEDAYEVSEEGEPESSEVNEHLLKNVEELELSVRSYNCLKNADIRTLADLVQRTEQEMLRTKNFGRKSLNEIKEIIELMGLHFNMRVDVDELQKLQAMKRTPENAT
jgi:DNA-directed RNA polymerase subunit alpha